MDKFELAYCTIELYSRYHVSLTFEKCRKINKPKVRPQCLIFVFKVIMFSLYYYAETKTFTYWLHFCIQVRQVTIITLYHGYNCPEGHIVIYSTPKRESLTNGSRALCICPRDNLAMLYIILYLDSEVNFCPWARSSQWKYKKFGLHPFRLSRPCTYVLHICAVTIQVRLQIADLR